MHPENFRSIPTVEIVTSFPCLPVVKILALFSRSLKLIIIAQSGLYFLLLIYMIYYIFQLQNYLLKQPHKVAILTHAVRTSICAEDKKYGHSRTEHSEAGKFMFQVDI